MRHVSTIAIEPEAQKLFEDIKKADAEDEAERVRLGTKETYGGHRRAVLRDALFSAYEKGRASAREVP
jgi:hypothetical protein